MPTEVGLVTDIMPRYTMEVRITQFHQFRIRLWLACKLLRLAGLVLNCGVEIDPLPLPVPDPSLREGP